MAKPYPDWVPQESLDYFESLSDPFSREPKYDPEDTEILRSAITSFDMKRAWLSIKRRRSKASPKKFAMAIVQVSAMSRQIDRFETPDRIKEVYDLSTKTHNLAAEVAKKARRMIGEDWYDECGYPLRSFFKCPPYQALCELAEYFEASARDMEETRTELTAYVGKPGSQDARRIYAVRLMSEEMRHIYGQPLHEVVARSCSEIIGEDVDQDLVRKLVKLGERLPKSYWSG